MIRLTETRWKALLALADVVAPPEGQLPSGRSVLAERHGFARIAAARPDLIKPVERLLDRFGGDADLFLDDLAARNPTALHDLMTVVAGAYYMDHGVRTTIGYPGSAAAYRLSEW